MKNQIISLALIATLGACSGGNPFETGQVTDTDGSVDGDTGIPAALSQNLESFTYDPDQQTLTVVGIPSDRGVLDGVYTRKENLDRLGYEAYTAQDGSLDRHVTAYVRDIRGTRAAVVVTGGQFEETFAGGAYDGADYTAPESTTEDTGLVTYAGTYVGLLNGGGSDEDLLDVEAGTSPSVLSAQAAEVTGNIVITGDFADSSVSGVIYDRVIVDVDSDGFDDPASADPLAIIDIALDATDIASDGTFSGVATQDDSAVGDYGGIFGGTGATEVAGIVSVAGHVSGYSGIEEDGVFVLSQCGQPDEDAVCNQPHR